MRPEHWLFRIPLRLRSLFRRAQVDWELDEELRDHLGRATEEYVAKGMTQEEANRRARLDLGGIEQTKEKCRDARRVNWIQDLIQDLRFGLRILRKSPGFTLVAVLTLALGIGATTAIFSLVNGILLQPLPYRQPQQLYLIREVVPRMGQTEGSWPANLRNFDEWRKHSLAFSEMAVAEPMSADFSAAAEAKEIYGAHVSANLFHLLGVSVGLGRTFLPEEDEPGRDNVVIVTNSFWRDELRSDPVIIGKSITLNGVPNEVIGVLPATFHFFKNDQLGARVQFGSQIEFFKPLGVDLSTVFPLGNFRFAAIARLKPGVTPSQALADLNVVQTQIASDLAKNGSRKMELRAELTPLESEVIGTSRRGLLLLLASVATVLLILCVNLAGLMLARATLRQREAAIRISLGASRARVISQTLTEALPLPLLGGFLGVAFTYLGLQWLIASAPVDLPRLDQVQIDFRVLCFCLAVSLGAGLLFAILPAWRNARVDPQQTLKSGGTTMTSDRATGTLRQSLIVFEVALTVVLVIVAGTLSASLARVLLVDKGFNADSALAVDVALPPQSYSQQADRLHFYDSARLAVANLPFVRSDGWISKLPLEGQAFILVVNVPGIVQEDYSKFMANFRLGSPDYFRAMGIPLLQGRVFDESDRAKNVAVISQTVARQVWPGENPIGKQFHPGPNNAPLAEVIGVVGDVRTVRLDEPPLPMVYLPYWNLQAPMTASLIVRTHDATPSSVASEVRRALRSIDPQVPVVDVRTMDQVVSDSVATRKFQTALARSFGFCALFLAGLGVFSVASYSVSQRRQELGIRMALGASSSNVRLLILRDGMKPILLGMLLGTAASFVVGMAIGSLFFGVRMGDPLLLALSATIVLAVGLLACYIPARRAMRIDPMVALRYE